MAGIALETTMAFNAMSVLLSRYDAYRMLFSREFTGEAPSFFGESHVRQRPPFGSLKNRVSVRKLQERGTPYQRADQGIIAGHGHRLWKG
jgi:hypothetical protein